VLGGGWIVRALARSAAVDSGRPTLSVNGVVTPALPHAFTART
jgi:hypothetical protein